jgi:hypothetical protein
VVSCPQGERAAANAKLPFVVVGRKLSKDSLVKALAGYVAPGSAAALAAAAEAALAAAAAAENKAAAHAWFGSAAGWRPPAT